MEYSDRNYELSPDDSDTVPGHSPWVNHRKRHGEHLPSSQADSVDDGYYGRGPLRNIPQSSQVIL